MARIQRQVSFLSCKPSPAVLMVKIKRHHVWEGTGSWEVQLLSGHSPSKGRPRGMEHPGASELKAVTLSSWEMVTH